MDITEEPGTRFEGRDQSVRLGRISTFYTLLKIFSGETKKEDVDLSTFTEQQQKAAHKVMDMMIYAKRKMDSEGEQWKFLKR